MSFIGNPTITVEEEKRIEVEKKVQQEKEQLAKDNLCGEWEVCQPLLLNR